MAQGLGVMYTVTFTAADNTAAGCVLNHIARSTVTCDTSGANSSSYVKNTNTTGSSLNTGTAVAGDVYVVEMFSPAGTQFTDGTVTCAALKAAAISVVHTASPTELV